MIPDRRHRRIRGWLSRLTWPLLWPLRRWTRKDQRAYQWEIAFVRRERWRRHERRRGTP